MASEAEHTPSEWGFEFKSDHTVIRSMEKCDRPGAGYVCHVNKNNVSKAEREANENLISAAPDLLGVALKTQKMLKLIRVAGREIEVPTGMKSQPVQSGMHVVIPLEDFSELEALAQAAIAKATTPNT